MDFSAMTVEHIKTLQTNISGELAKRAGRAIDLRFSDTPKGGAIFYDRPAIGGDRNLTLWFPTLEAANAHLVQCADGHTVKFRKDGTTFCDYTRPGCSQSAMEVEHGK